ncbi:MAG TPA: efflux RND transporter permease subunit [Myxococcota bacterium]|jgi:hydrophobe/amphiphile efflux-1 (HAE1) family protein|nr:efflux RND transporter permease subunit [Myxococcota bacterium]
MKISDVAIDRPVFTTMVALGVLVLGGLALARLGVDLFPNVSFPVVVVVTPYPGAGPEEIESLVTRPIEESVSAINGVDDVRSYSRDSVSTVVVQFKLEADIRQAASDVRDRVAAIRGKLPKDALDPVISRVDPTAIPVVTYAVASPRSSLDTRTFVDDVIRPVLERVDGVGSVVVNGGAVREIRVELDRAKLEAVGLTVAQVAALVGGESFDVPAGRITVGPREVGVTSVGRFRSVAEVGEVVLMARPDGTQVKVSDVGTVVDGTVEERTITRVNGVDAVTFQVQKQAGTNTVAVVDGVEKALAALAPRIPSDIKVTKTIDASKFVRNNIAELRKHLVLGGLLAVAVIFLFMLDWRSTFISALALPTSIVASFFVMWMMGFTLNMMTMMGLTLSVGMLIDDSVVVRENIFRHMERGEDPMTAARRGTAEIALAVLATTLTIVAVFGPVAFMGGLVGSFFREFGLTVSAAVLVSLVVSFTLDPMLSARIVQKIAPDHHERMRRHVVFGPILRAYDGLDALYRRILGWTLRHRKTTVAAAVALFVGSLMLVPLMGQEFFGRGDQGDFAVNVELPAGTALTETARMTTAVEKLVREMPEVVTVATTIGPNGEVNKASIRVKATEKTARARSLAMMMEELRPKLATIPGLVYNMREAGLGGETDSAMMEAPISLNISGDDYGELGHFAEEAFAALRTVRGVRDATISYKPGSPEERLVIDRPRAADLGVSFPSLALTLRAAVEGDIVGKYRDGEHESDIRVLLRPEDRGSLEAVRAVTVASMRGKLLHVAEVTKTERAATPATIERLNRERIINISANVSGRSLGEVVADVEATLGKLERPAAVNFEFAGEADRMKETFSNLFLAFGLAILFIYFVLASQFESFLHPFTIMLALPLAMVGALLTLFLTNFPIGMPAMIGIILLMGLVTKNSILLVDYTNQLRERGHKLLDALLEAGPTRLRPILMTSAAIVLGMLPNALGRGEGSEFRAPMSIAVIGGVIASTLLTLVVVPAVYVWVDRLTLRGRRERREARAGAAAGAAATGPAGARGPGVPAPSTAPASPSE